jgi:hypothetical protein
VNYGQNVIIARLIDGEERRIDEKTSCMVEEAFDTNISIEVSGTPKEDLTSDLGLVVKKISSREQLVEKMKDALSKTAARKLIWAVIISGLVLISIVILEYTLTMQSRADADSRTQILVETYSLVEQLYAFLYLVRQALLSHDAIYSPYISEAAVRAAITQEMTDIIDSLSQTEARYYLEPDLYTQSHNVFYSYYFGNTSIGEMRTFKESVSLVCRNIIR